MVRRKVGTWWWQLDVSKALLDVSMAEGPVHRFENSGPGLRRWPRHMDRAGTTQAVCEVTGGYERLLVSRPGAAGITAQAAAPDQLSVKRRSQPARSSASWCWSWVDTRTQPNFMPSTPVGSHRPERAGRVLRDRSGRLLATTFWDSSTSFGPPTESFSCQRASNQATK